jgi:MFS family permease
LVTGSSSWFIKKSLWLSVIFIFFYKARTVKIILACAIKEGGFTPNILRSIVRKELIGANAFAPFRCRDVRGCLQLELWWSAFFGTSIMASYYNAKGLDQTDIYLLQATIAVVSVVGDIPCGYLADRFGVKRIIVIGCAVQIVQAAIFWRSNTFWQFEAVIVLTGVAWCLISGTTSSLASARLEGVHYSIYEKWAVQAGGIGRVVGIIAGDQMVRHADMTLPYACQPLVYCIAIIVALRLDKSTLRQKRPGSRSIVRTARRMLVDTPKIRWVVLFFATMHVAVLSYFWLMQPVLREAGFQIKDFTLFYLLMSAAIMAFGWTASSVRRCGFIGEKLIILCVTTLGTIGASFLAGLAGGVLFVAVYSFGVALITQMQRVTLDALLPPDSGLRTTELSVASAIQSLAFAAVCPTFGVIADATSPTTAIRCIAIAAFFAGSCFLYKVARAKGV